jgi:hypothetical protein
MSPSREPRMPFAPPKAQINSTAEFCAVQFGAHDKAFGGRERQHRQIQFAVAEQRVADGVKQRAGAIARDNLLRVIQPFHAGGSFDAEAQVAAATGQVERELRLVAAVNAEGGVQAIERAVEKFRAVGDDKIAVPTGQ